MSSKITKRMMSNVDDMVSRASTAARRTGVATTKRKAAKRALLEAPSKKCGGKGVSSARATKSGRRSVSKIKTTASGRPIGLLEQARQELRGKSRAARNVSLLSYSRGRQGGGAAGAGGRGGGVVAVTATAVSKSRKAVDKLLEMDRRRAV